MSDSNLVEQPEPEFPLQLIATVAATLLAGKLSREEKPISYLWVADQAVELLRACKTRSKDPEFFDQVRSERAVAEAKKRVEIVKQSVEFKLLEEKYPSGMTWKKGLLYVTKLRSETEAIVPFKRWRAFEVARQRMSQFTFGPGEIQPDAMDEEDALKEIIVFKNHGFTSKDAFRLRAEFGSWYQENIGRKKNHSE